MGVWRITLRASALLLAWSFMPDYRRFRVPGGTYFFTVNLLERRLDTLVRHVDALREAVRVTRRERRFISTPGWSCPTTCIASGPYAGR